MIILLSVFLSDNCKNENNSRNTDIFRKEGKRKICLRSYCYNWLSSFPGYCLAAHWSVFLCGCHCLLHPPFPASACTPPSLLPFLSHHEFSDFKVFAHFPFHSEVFFKFPAGQRKDRKSVIWKEHLQGKAEACLGNSSVSDRQQSLCLFNQQASRSITTFF